MCHRAGDLPEGAQAAGSNELLLELRGLLAQLGFAVAENFFDALSVGEIPRDDRKTDEVPAFVAQRGDNRVGPEARSVLAHAPSLLLAAPVDGGVAQRLARQPLGLIFGRVKAPKRFADDFFVLVTFDVLSAGIPGRYPALDVEHEDRILLHAFDQQAKTLLALLDRFLFQPLVDVE